MKNGDKMEIKSSFKNRVKCELWTHSLEIMFPQLGLFTKKIIPEKIEKNAWIFN